MTRADIAIIGAGMAGASLAAELAGRATVLLLEGEDQPGYHATGRSAAFWSESYGGPLVQPLTSASGRFLAHPPADFSDRSFLSTRGALHLADEQGQSALAAMEAEFAQTSVRLERVGASALSRMLPSLRPGWSEALWEASCADIDVARLHACYLAQARRGGVMLVTDALVERAERCAAGWEIETRQGRFEAGILVNAAGAWADEVAQSCDEPRLGVRPYRRTIAQLRVSPAAPADLPLVIDILGRFYFKPEAGGRLWLSPHDESPCDPCDVGAEEMDVALAVHRLKEVVDWRVERVEHSWAGLRSFAPDRLPVYGFAGGRRDFFWFAGQGGFGIQTAPAAAKIGAALLLGEAPDPLVDGIDPSPYLGARFEN